MSGPGILPGVSGTAGRMPGPQPASLARLETEIQQGMKELEGMLK